MLANRSYVSSSIYAHDRVFVSDELKKAGQEDIVFVHIPKTGGTNIACLVNAIADSGKVSYHRFAVKRQEGVSPNLFKLGGMGGYPDQATFETVKAQKSPRFISGHMPTGLIKEADFKGRYITLVRDPVERAVSSINFDYQRGYLAEEDVETYARSTMIDNLQTRLIAGKDYMDGECTEETYCEATRRIDKDFLFAAPTEAADSVTALVGALYDEKKVASARFQVTGDTLYDVNFPPEHLESILTRRNRFDTRLHEHVVNEWVSFKSHHVTELQLYDEDTYLTLPPDMLKTKKWERLTIHEIEDFNRKGSGSLIRVEQQ